MNPSSDSQSEREQALNRLVKEYYQACEQGRAPDTTELIARHPEYADDLREFFSGLGQLQHNVPQRAADRELADSRGNVVTRVTATERPGAMIGPYKLLQKLGEGGMGAVYLAEQQEPVRRQVALKIIKAGMDSAQVIARFEQERQALAMMDHPNIARIIDAGTVGQASSLPNETRQAGRLPHDGRPYFVMELVKGIPITRYCDQEHLSPKERLELFIPVCQAVQHAHQKGIIHRDLKPSNVLIALYDGRPVPKVIDFGVAKATSQKLTERTLFTEVGSIVGTLEYMAPEQAELNNLDIDTRADIYSLGVLLYELLAGAPPFSSQQLRSAGFNEMLRIIKEVEPQKPSTKLSTSAELPSIAANRRLEPARLTKAVRGDLDWIVMKCLEKERARRYETANAFALDIQRYLDDEPVLAGPPSAAYRLKKFLRRNKGPALAAAVLLLTLLGGIIGTTWGLIRAESARQAETRQRKLAEESRQAESVQRKLAQAAEATAQANERQAAAERDRAEQEKRIAQAVKDFLQNRLLNQAEVRNQADALLREGGTSAGVKPNPTIRDLLDRAAAELTDDKIEAQFPNLQLVQAEILRTIGDTYSRLGEMRAGIAHLERAHRLYVAQLGAEHPETISTSDMLGLAYRRGGKYQQSIKLFQQVRDAQIARLGPDHPETLTALSHLAAAYADDAQYSESLKIREQVRDKRVATLGQDHLDTVVSQFSLAWEYARAGKLAEAIKLYEEVRDKRVAKLGPDHPDTLWVMTFLGSSYQAAGRLPESIKILEQVRERQITTLGLSNQGTLQNQLNLARAYRAAGRLPEAIQLYEQARDIYIATHGPDHPNTLVTLNGLALAYQATGRLPEAIQLFEHVREKQIATMGPDHAYTLAALNYLAYAYRDAGRLPEAIQLFEQVRDKRLAKFGPDNGSTRDTLSGLAVTYQRSGRVPEAIQLYEQIVPSARRMLGPIHSNTILYTNNWASALEADRQFNKAVAVRRELLDIQRKQFPATDPRLATALAALGTSLLRAEQFAEAETVVKECLTIREQTLPDDWQTFNAKSLLGGALAAQKKFEGAEPLLLAGYEGLKSRGAKIPASVRTSRLTAALQRLIDLYTAWDKPDEAEKWKTELDARSA